MVCEAGLSEEFKRTFLETGEQREPTVVYGSDDTDEQTRISKEKQQKTALHFTPLQTSSIEYHIGFIGKHPATLQLMRENTIRAQISTTVYSQVLIRTAERKHLE